MTKLSKVEAEIASIKTAEDLAIQTLEEEYNAAIAELTAKKNNAIEDLKVEKKQEREELVLHKNELGTSIGGFKNELEMVRLMVRNTLVDKNKADRHCDVSDICFPDFAQKPFLTRPTYLQIGMTLADSSTPKLLTLAQAPFDILQEIHHADTREDLWNYVQGINEDGTGVFRVRSQQLFIKANGIEDTNAWKKLVATEAPLGMAGSKFRSCHPRGTIAISGRKATLEESYGNLCDMIALPVDSFSPRHHQKVYV